MATDKKQMIGLEVSEGMNELIVLASIYSGTSKSEIIRKALENYFVGSESPKESKEYITGIRQDFKIEYEKRKLNSPGVDEDFIHENFIESKKKKLENMGLQQTTVNKLLKIKK